MREETSIVCHPNWTDGFTSHVHVEDGIHAVTLWVRASYVSGSRR